MESQKGDEDVLFPDPDGTLNMRRRSSTSNFNQADSDTDDADSSDIVIIMIFDKHVSRTTMYWIIDKIRGKKSTGGAELIIGREPVTSSSDGLTLHISISKMRLLELADELGIMKMSKSGLMRNFNVVSLDDFFTNDEMDVDDLLTPADRQIILKHALESIKAKQNEKNIPGTADYLALYHGQSIIEAAIDAGIIVDFYTLHDTEIVKKLGSDWYTKFFNQPIHSIRKYFGESVGIYFAFAGFYTMSLAVPTILGVFQYFLSYETLPFFCIFYVVWMTVFTEIWKRRSSVLAYKWGTIAMTNLDLPRIGYYGEIKKDAVTGKMTPQYPLYKTYVKMYCISFPVIIFCIVAATYMALAQFWVEDSLRVRFGADSWIIYIPSVIQATVVFLLSILYGYLATFLTDLENHRTTLQYERHRVNKLIILEFVNNFFSLFYIAFILQDIKQLSNQLMTQLIIVQAFQNLQETLYPIAKQRVMDKLDKYNSGGYSSDIKYTNLKEEPQDEYDDMNISKLEPDNPKIQQNHYEKNLEFYHSPYEDYLELYVQFGYVVLFSSVSPLAAFWALLNNVLEIRVDAFKLCKMYRRPFAKRAKDTGAWLLAFQIMSLMAIVTNCGILCLSPQIKHLGPTLRDAEWVIVMVLLEHALFIVVWCIHKAIPDCPHWIRVALAKADYESRQALKRETGQQSKNILFRRFRSFYDKKKAEM